MQSAKRHEYTIHTILLLQFCISCPQDIYYKWIFMQSSFIFIPISVFFHAISACITHNDDCTPEPNKNIRFAFKIRSRKQWPLHRNKIRFFKLHVVRHNVAGGQTHSNIHVYNLCIQLRYVYMHICEIRKFKI